MATDPTKQLFDAAADCTADTFAPREGDLFVAQPLSNPELSFQLKLVAVTRFPHRTTFNDREQFSVLFDAVGENRMQKGELCKILDNGTEWLILFVNPVTVPSAEAGSNILYETAFA